MYQESELVEVVVGDEKEPRLDIRLQKVIQRTLYRILRQQTNLTTNHIKGQLQKRPTLEVDQPYKATNPKSGNSLRRHIH